MMSVCKWDCNGAVQIQLKKKKERKKATSCKKKEGKKLFSFLIRIKVTFTHREC